MTRIRLPDIRNSVTHKFKVGRHKGYLIVGLYEDGSPGELFIHMSAPKTVLDIPDPPESLVGDAAFDAYRKSVESTIAQATDELQEMYAYIKGSLDQFALCISLLRQLGVPLEDLVNKFAWSRFPPDGITSNKSIRIATSLSDYVVRYLKQRFLKEGG